MSVNPERFANFTDWELSRDQQTYARLAVEYLQEGNPRLALNAQELAEACGRVLAARALGKLLQKGK